MKNAIEICCIRENELGLLKDFLYEAIFIPEGVEPPSRDIVEKPELRVYTDGFGTKSGDNCLAAIHDGKIVGAVWTRIMNDYGHVDDETPSFAISLYKEYRRKGIGTRLQVGTDIVCENCPNNEAGDCTTADKVKKHDEEVLKACGLVEGIELFLINLIIVWT